MDKFKFPEIKRIFAGTIKNNPPKVLEPLEPPTGLVFYLDYKYEGKGISQITQISEEKRREWDQYEANRILTQKQEEEYDAMMSKTHWIRYEKDPNGYCSHSPRIKKYIPKTEEEILRSQKAEQEAIEYRKIHNLDIPVEQRPFDVHHTLYIGSGGFGDALMVMNKFKTLGLHEKGATIQWYTDQEKTLELVKQLFELNGIPQTGAEKPYHYYGAVTPDTDRKIRLFKEKRNVFTTAWNGDISGDENALKSFLSDNVEVSENFEVKGIPISKPVTKERYYILQLDAGLIYHNPRKHWDNKIPVLQFAKQINKRFGLKALVVGNNSASFPDDSFVDISDKGFEITEYIKGAQFVLCLSGFVALASLMLGKQTIMKYETEFINQRYYGHPGWKQRLHLIEEILPNLNSMVEVIEKLPFNHKA